jgi:hypothetical protein
MLKWVIGIALGAGLAMSPLAVVAQTDQSAAPAAAPAAAPEKTGPHHPRRHMKRRRMHMQRTGHMPPHPAAEAPAKTQ